MTERSAAWGLLCEYTQSESLQKHALAVEACLRAYARKFAEDENLWGNVGLLHDFDYERWPNDAHSPTEEHPSAGSKILRERGYPEEMIRAIMSHADYTGVPRQSPLEHTLFACDELAGFLTACALVKPGKSIAEVEPDSVKRKMKDKAFARGVNRDDVRKGAEELEASLGRREKMAMDRIAQAEAEALAQVRNAAVDVAAAATRQLIAQNLDFYMARAFHIFLHQQRAIAKGPLRFAACRAQGFLEFARGTHNAHPASAATRGGLDQHRKAGP